MTLTVLKSTGFVFHRISLNLKFSDFFFIIRFGGFCFSRSVVSDSCNSTGLLCPRDFPGKNTGMGCHFLLAGKFLNQGFPEPDELASLESPALQADS